MPYAPVHAAAELGYYKTEGLDVGSLLFGLNL